MFTADYLEKAFGKPSLSAAMEWVEAMEEVWTRFYTTRQDRAGFNWPFHHVFASGLFPENIVMGINYGFNKVRFLAPVRAGKRVRAHVEVVDVEAKDGNRFLITQAVSVEIEGEETPALVAEWLSMVVAG